MLEKKKHILFDTEIFNDSVFIFYWHIVEDGITHCIINPSREDIRAVFADYFVDLRIYRDNPLSIMELDKYLRKKNFKRQVALCREVKETLKHYRARIMEVEVEE